MKTAHLRKGLVRYVVVALVATSAGGVAAASRAEAADVATFHGQSPARLMDTRAGFSTIDGVAAGSGAIRSGATATLTVLGRGGIPATGVGAVALNVTVTAPTGKGYVTVFPTGSTQPTASNLNFSPGQTIPNMVLVPVGTGGKVSIFNSDGSSDVIVDVLGWFPTGASFTGLNPARLLDTRAGTTTTDGVGAGTGAVAANGTAVVTASGRGGVPATGAGAVALNVTVTNPTVAGYLTVFPTGSTRPTASNLNFIPSQTIPNMVIVPVGSGGKISVFNGSGGTADVIVDVLGWFPTGSAFTGLTPARLLDSRVGQPTIDGRFDGIRAVATSTSTNVIVTGRGGVPATNVGAVALNVTATNPTADGYLTVYPTGSNPPTASNLNFSPGQTIPNMVIVPVGTSGQVSIYNSAGDTDVIVDVLGWFPNPTTPPTSYGNSFTLKANGIGTAAFGSAPSTVINLLQPLLGAPTIDYTEAFPTFGQGFWNNPNGDYFDFPFARVVCLGPFSNCFYFGSMTASGLTFQGYFYGDPYARLLNADGVGIGSRAADFPGSVQYVAGGCYSSSGGQLSDGLLVDIVSKGVPFSETDDAGNYVSHLPAASDVFVTDVSSGSLIGSEDADC